MEKNQCSYYMYLSNFEARAFLAERLLVCMDCHLNVHVSARWHISSHMHSLQDEVEVANDHDKMQRRLSGSTSKEFLSYLNFNILENQRL